MKFSVVMPVYAKDKPEWFEQALDSILSQTLVSDDIVVIADGPLNEGLEESLNKYKYTVSVVRIKQNQGLSNALNVGISKAKHDLIARMDSDDIALRGRFELQVAEFIKNQELGILGGQIAEFIDNPDEIASYRRVPIGHDDIVNFARRRSPFNHPTVMYRKSIIEKLGGYDISALRIEDYDLWLRAIHSGVEVANLDEVLVNYRSNKDAMKRRKTFSSFRSHIYARARFFTKKYISFSDLCYGLGTQTVLFILPDNIANTIFKKAVRSEK